MNNKSKWIILVLSICLCCSFVAIGALALREVSLNIGGTIDFKSVGVEATISNATITNTYDELPALESFNIKKRTTQDEIEQKMSAWANLPLAFNDNGTDIVISFDVKNNATNSDSYIEVDYEYTLTTTEGFTDNADIFPSSSNEYIIAPGKTNTIKLLVKVLNKKADVSISAMNLSIKLNYIEAVASSDWEFIADKPNVGEATLTKFVGTLPDDGVLSIPAVIKNSSNRYIVSVIDNEVDKNHEYLYGQTIVPQKASDVNFTNSIKKINGMFCSTSNINIKTLDLPISLTEIGDFCFVESCILALQLPNGLTRIGENAFLYGKIRSINLPYMLKEIDYAAFTGTQLINVEVADNVSSWLVLDMLGYNTNVTGPTILTTIGTNIRYNSCTFVKIAAQQIQGDFTFAITGEGHRYLIGYSGSSSQLTLPTISNGYDIANGVFRGNTTLKQLTIPACVGEIGAYAFYGCTSLVVLNLNEGIKILGYGAFYGTSIIAINIPASITRIYASFGNATKLTSVTFTDNSSYWTGTRGLEDDVCGGIVKVGAEISIAMLKDVSRNWIKYENIEFSGDYAFTTIDDVKYLVGYTGSATQLTLPTIEGGYKIAASTFTQTTTITSVTIPSCVTEIGGYAFGSCTNLGTITLSDGIEKIEGYSFNACTKLTSITIPSSVKSIGMQAFAGCSKLASVTLNEGLEEISNSFYNCSLLTTITIPSTVKFMGLNAFSGTGLTTAKFNKSSGWSVVASNGAITQIEVTSDLTEANATLLKTTYKSYYWINS